MQDSGLMRWNLHILDKGWVGPDGDAVIREARSRSNLLVVVAPAKTGHLAARIDGVDASTSGGVPEVDVAIVGASTCG